MSEMHSTSARRPSQDPVALSRLREVRAAISAVRDPEIDETVESLDFIVDVGIDEDRVTVSLRLPTFWCPANFVFLMAEEMRRAVQTLPWVGHFELRLVDHFAAEEINRAICQGRSFKDAFPNDAVRDLTELRRTFDEKAFLMRQGALVSVLRRGGLDDETIAKVTPTEIARLASGSEEVAEAWAAYRLKWEALSLPIDAEEPAIIDPDGCPVAAGGLPGHLRKIRGMTTSASANGEMCRMLMASRANGPPGCASLSSRGGHAAATHRR